jgi:glycosyltransferase involved in cell wall biosynthesis
MRARGNRGEHIEPNNRITVTVVITAKNAQDTIGKTLSSLAGQTRSADEIILVVDSLDDSTVVAASPFQIKTCVNEAGGVGAARQKGVEASTGDVVAFIDADCIADGYWLEALASTFTKRKDVKVQAGRTVSTSDASGKVDFDKNERLPKERWVFFSETMNFAFRRDILGVVGNFDPRFHEGGEDLDFCVRLKRADFGILFNADAVVYHLGSGRATKKAWRDGRTRASNLFKHGRAIIRPSFVALFHSVSIIATLVLLFLGIYALALVAILPSIVHRLYGTLRDIRGGQSIRLAARKSALDYVANFSFFVYVLASIVRAPFRLGQPHA